ncbi:MAG: hypothetical protein ABIS44_06495 [Mycobacteriales bacterium]
MIGTILASRVAAEDGELKRVELVNKPVSYIDDAGWPVHQG